MAGSEKAGFNWAAFATGVSLIAISVSVACLVHVFFLASPNATQCSCPQNGKPDELRNRTAEEARVTIKAATEEIGDTKTREDAGRTVEQTTVERKVRKRRQSSTQTQTQVNGNTAFGGYLHNAILRLQQQMIVVEGR